MLDLNNATFGISDTDVIRKTSRVKQLVDILRVDVGSINGSGEKTTSSDIKTRKSYEVFVTGGVGDGMFPVTSSLFQTIHDQDFETQTSNELFDITLGCYSESSLINSTIDTTRGLEDPDAPGTFTGIDSSGKKLFASDTMMMREKINIYKQYAQYLLGDSSSFFTAPYESEFVHTGSNSQLDYRERIDEAIFINFKRLFVRDGIVKEQIVLRMLEKATAIGNNGEPNIGIDGDSASETTITDTGALSSLRVTSSGGSVATLVKDSVETGEDENVGLIFYEKGIVVLDAKRIFDTTQVVSGTIMAVTGLAQDYDSATGALQFNNTLIPHLWTSGSIDNILDHICETRFGRSNATAIGLINQTFVNSSIFVCRVAPSQANYSRNPTYTNNDGTIRVIEERGDDPFAYITTIGLYDVQDNLLAVAKTSRPIEKNPETDLSISVRIDY